MWKVRAAGRRVLARGLSTGGGATRPVLGALVERLPIVTPPVAEWKQKNLEWQSTVHEHLAKHYPPEFLQAEEAPDAKAARLKIEAIVDAESRRTGSGDDNDDQASTDRCLEQRLYLLLKVDGAWRFPQVDYTPGESTSARDLIMQKLMEVCGSGVVLRWMGNAPAAHYEQKSGSGTLFLYKVQVLSGGLSGVEHAWLTKEELADRLGGEFGAFAMEVCGPFP